MFPVERYGVASSLCLALPTITGPRIWASFSALHTLLGTVASWQHWASSLRTLRRRTPLHFPTERISRSCKMAKRLPQCGQRTMPAMRKVGQHSVRSLGILQARTFRCTATHFRQKERGKVRAHFGKRVARKVRENFFAFYFHQHAHSAIDTLKPPKQNHFWLHGECTSIMRPTSQVGQSFHCLNAFLTWLMACPLSKAGPAIS